MRLWLLAAVAAATITSAIPAPAQDRELMEVVDTLKRTPDELNKAHPLAPGALASKLGVGSKPAPRTGVTREMITAVEESSKAALQREAQEKARARRQARRAAQIAAQVATAASAPPPVRRITGEQLSAVDKGMTRDALLAKLGAPSFASAVSGLEEGPRETMIYHLAADQTAAVRLIDGKVHSIER